MDDTRHPQWEVVGALPAQQVKARWLALLAQHLTDGAAWGKARVVMGDAVGFWARIRSAPLGGLHYCHVEASAHRLDIPAQAEGLGSGPMVVLQLSGMSVFERDGHAVQARPGSMLFIEAVRGTFSVEHRGRVEQLLLMLRSVPEAAAAAARRGLLHRDGGEGHARLIFRLLCEACLIGGLAQEAASELGETLSGLIAQVFFEDADDAPSPARTRVSRAMIEDYVRRRLGDATLDLPRLAAALNCSVRSLHRAFQRPGSVSLERWLWQTRIEAAAEALRSPADAQRPLVDIASRCGFVSRTHFSKLFRERYGESPSAFRRRCFQDAAASRLSAAAPVSAAGPAQQKRPAPAD